MPNFRMYARGRPHTWQRLWKRTAYFGFCFHLSIADFFANPIYLYLLNGMPSWVSRERASSSLLAVVTMDTSRPRSLSMLS